MQPTCQLLSPGENCLGTNHDKHEAFVGMVDGWCSQDLGGLLSWEGSFEAAGPCRVGEELGAWAFFTRYQVCLLVPLFS